MRSWTGFRRFASANVASYLAAYRTEWQHAYDSFRVTANDEAELADALLALTRPSSPQLGLMREAQAQTALTADDAAPWAKDFAAVKGTFDGLSGAVDDKAFGEYQSLLLELANAATEGRSNGAARSAAPAAATAKPAGGKSDPVDTFIQDLTGLARVLVSGVREPKSDVRGRLQAWLDASKVPAELRPIFWQPIDSAYGSGRVSLTKAMNRFWSEQRGKLDAELLAKYPFAPTSDSDASVAAVTAWLEPTEGRFFTEMAPVIDFLSENARALGVAVPASMSDTAARLRAVSRTLFDAKGEPTPILVKWEPVPFSASSVKGSTLVLGDVYERYFNTVPRTTVLSVPWTTEYVASLKLESRGGNERRCEDCGDPEFQVPLVLLPFARRGQNRCSGWNGRRQHERQVERTKQRVPLDATHLDVFELERCELEHCKFELDEPWSLERFERGRKGRRGDDQLSRLRSRPRLRASQGGAAMQLRGSLGVATLAALLTTSCGIFGSSGGTAAKSPAPSVATTDPIKVVFETDARSNGCSALHVLVRQVKRTDYPRVEYADADRWLRDGSDDKTLDWLVLMPGEVCEREDPQARW
ncbi:MAG: hypothetical protein QM784_22005 [Polyangiaceae bacterium]